MILCITNCVHVLCPLAFFTKMERKSRWIGKGNLWGASFVVTLLERVAHLRTQYNTLRKWFNIHRSVMGHLVLMRKLQSVMSLIQHIGDALNVIGECDIKNHQEDWLRLQVSIEVNRVVCALLGKMSRLYEIQRFSTASTTQVNIWETLAGDNRDNRKYTSILSPSELHCKTFSLLLLPMFSNLLHILLKCHGNPNEAGINQCWDKSVESEKVILSSSGHSKRPCSSLSLSERRRSLSFLFVFTKKDFLTS